MRIKNSISSILPCFEPSIDLPNWPTCALPVNMVPLHLAQARLGNTIPERKEIGRQRRKNERISPSEPNHPFDYELTHLDRSAWSYHLPGSFSELSKEQKAEVARFIATHNYRLRQIDGGDEVKFDESWAEQLIKGLEKTDE